MNVPSPITPDQELALEATIRRLLIETARQERVSLAFIEALTIETVKEIKSSLLPYGSGRRSDVSHGSDYERFVALRNLQPHQREQVIEDMLNLIYDQLQCLLEIDHEFNPLMMTKLRVILDAVCVFVDWMTNGDSLRYVWSEESKNPLTHVPFGDSIETSFGRHPPRKNTNAGQEG